MFWVLLLWRISARLLRELWELRCRMTLLRSLEVEITHMCIRSRRAILVVQFRRMISIIVTIRTTVVLLSLEVLEVVLEVVLEMALFGIELLSSQD
jgi:hypothetical protein